jgi:hypothetical protein
MHSCHNAQLSAADFGCVINGAQFVARTGWRNFLVATTPHAHTRRGLGWRKSVGVLSAEGAMGAFALAFNSFHPRAVIGESVARHQSGMPASKGGVSRGRYGSSTGLLEVPLLNRMPVMPHRRRLPAQNQRSRRYKITKIKLTGRAEQVMRSSTQGKCYMSLRYVRHNTGHGGIRKSGGGV